MRLLQCSAVVVATFAFVRLLDHMLVAPSISSSVAPRAPCPSGASSTSTAGSLAGGGSLASPGLVGGTSDGLPPPSPSSHAAQQPIAAAQPGMRRRTAPHLAVIGFPVGIDERNRARRALLRELWYPEYPNLQCATCALRCEFVIGLLTYQGDGHDEATLQQLHDEHDAHADLALVNAREATRDPYRGDPKCTGEKIIAWFQQVVVVHRGTRFFIKADWDTWIHTVRLEHNLRSLLSPRRGPLYFGNTLWCSYSMRDYQPCGYGFGPLQAAGAKKTECPALPEGSSAIGPYPYAAGLFWGMSYELVQWIGGSRLVYDFQHNASARCEAPCSPSPSPSPPPSAHLVALLTSLTLTLTLTLT